MKEWRGGSSEGFVPLILCSPKASSYSLRVSVTAHLYPCIFLCRIGDSCSDVVEDLAPTRLPQSVPPPSLTTNCVAATFSSGACCCCTERRLSHSALHQKPDRNNFAVDPHINWWLFVAGL
ncbi:hypothetical protein NL676_008102 [Syzygium grande]|nr:hypothetical protein NL676_008102 [Syzygium grande]